MHREPIEIDDLTIRPHHLFHTKWMLITSGDFNAGSYNTMTIGWGAIGTMWSKPFAFVAVRHSRFTYDFMEQYNTFSLSAFPEQYQPSLSLLGSQSGRDGNKISVSGLTPAPGKKIDSPSFLEAKLVIECQKMYFNDLNPDQFLDNTIHDHYPQQDYHRIYYGEIIYCEGIKGYNLH